MKRKFPALYKKEVEKYGKERLKELDEEIKCLDCKWKDAVNLSTINPIKILSVAQLIGNETDPADIFRIPITALKKQDFCLYTDFDDKEKFKKLTVDEYEEGQEIPLETIEHFVDCKEHGVKILVFEHVPHILVSGEVDIRKADVIKYDPKNLLALASCYKDQTNENFIRNTCATRKQW